MYAAICHCFAPRHNNVHSTLRHHMIIVNYYCSFPTIINTPSTTIIINTPSTIMIPIPLILHQLFYAFNTQFIAPFSSPIIK